MKKLYGDRLDIALKGSRQVVALSTALQAQPPVHANRWARNGLSPSAQLNNQLTEAFNQAVLVRSKQVFAGGGGFGAVSTVSIADRARWRWAFHTGPYTHGLYVRCVLQNPDSSLSYTLNTSARCDIFNGAGSIVGTHTFNKGVSTKFGGIGIPDTWDDVVVIDKIITGISPDTDYTGLWTDQGGKLVSACVWECPSMTEHAGGYLSQNSTAMSPVLDVYREKMATIGRNLWRRGAAHLLNWHVEESAATVGSATGPRVTTSTTARNIIDDTSTAVSTATPGFTLDMRNKTRASQTTVPCVMKAYGRKSGVTPDGSVILKDSTGAAVATIPNAFIGPAGWSVPVAFNLPATVAKYDLHYVQAASGGGAGQFELHAVSVWQQD